MTFTAHVLIGTAIANRIPNPWLVGPIALATHLLCDAIPHWDLGTNWRKRTKIVTGFWASFETVSAVTLALFFFSSRVPSLISLYVSLVASLLPDWLEAPYYLFPKTTPKIFYYIYRVQSYIHSRMKLPWGIVTQILVVGIFWFLGFGAI